MSSNFVNLFNNVSRMIMTANYGANNFGNGAGTVTSQVSVFINNVNSSLPAQNANPLPPANILNTKENILINQQLQESILQTQEALKEFTQEDKSAFIKGMLDLPEDLSELLKNLVNKNEKLTNSEFLKLLSMLNVNGKEAATKLSKLMVFLGSNNIKGAEKLQEVYSIINALASGATQNASQLMKNIILLYLPWLPIGENNNFEIGLKESVKGKDGAKEDEDENSESDSITVFIQTVNFSNVKVSLFKGDGNQVNMFIDCVESFPKEELQNMVKGDSSKLNLDTQMSFSTTTAAPIEKNEETDFSVNVSKFIDPFLMLMAQAVIKAVIAIDKHTTLIETRKAG